MRKVSLLNYPRYWRTAATNDEVSVGTQLPCVGQLLQSRSKLKQQTVTAERQLAFALAEMGDPCVVMVLYIHPTGSSENRIISRLADFPYVDVWKGSETAGETVHRPRCQTGRTQGSDPKRNDSRAATRLRTKADRAFDKPIGHPRQEEACCYKPGSHQRCRWFAKTNDVSIRDQRPVPKIERVANQSEKNDPVIGQKCPVHHCVRT